MLSKHHPNQSERGATMPEYALMLGLLSIVCLMAVKDLGQSTNDSFMVAGNHMSGWHSMSISRDDGGGSDGTAQGFESSAEED